MDSHLASVRRRLRRLQRRLLIHRRLVAFVLICTATAIGIRVATAPPPETVAITVAARDLTGGTVISPGDLATAAFAPGTAPAGVVAQPVGAVVGNPVRRGEPITDARLLSTTLASPPAGLVAFPLRLQDGALAELLHPGDVVDFVATDPGTGDTAQIATAATILAIPHTPQGVKFEALNQGALVIIGIRETSVKTVAKSSARDFIVPVFRQ